MNAGRRKGFTLTEIVVTLGVTALLFSIATVSFNRINSGSSLGLAAETLASDMRDTIMKAVHNEQFQLQSPGGWGVYLDPVNERYVIFADLNNNREYETNEKYREVQLTGSIKIAYLTFNAGFPDAYSITFDVVSATPYFDGTAISTGDPVPEAGVVLEDVVNAVGKQVTVNFGGMVDVTSVEI